MNNALNQKVENLYNHFNEQFSPIISDGDMPELIRTRVENIHDQIAELYLSVINKSPVKNDEKSVIPENTNAEFQA